MSVNYTQPIINARLSATITAIGGPVFLVLTDKFNVTLVSLPLANPIGGVSGGGLIFTTPVTAAAVNTGSAALASIQTSSGGPIVSGLTVSSFSGDIIMGNPLITAGQTVTLTSGEIIGR